MSICRHIDRWTDRLGGLGAAGAVAELGVDGDREPDLVTVDRGQCVLELTPEPALELGPGEVVGDGDDRGVAVERDRFTGLDPRLLVGLQLLHHALPGGRQIQIVVHRVCPALLVAVPWSRRTWVRRPDALLVPQVCPHLVNVTASLWKRPAETLTVDRRKPDHRRSEAMEPSSDHLLRRPWSPG